MKKLGLTLLLFLLLAITELIGAQLIPLTKADEISPPNLSMPKEYINYTITNTNGTLWTKVEGRYPIKISTNTTDSPINLPMVYPTPPNTTNIHVTLNGKELSWSNYTQNYPEALHHTAIGDWSMIYCVLENVSEHFLLEIQYEHPIQHVNGSNLFLYDLNISPYLLPKSPNSTAYFTINLKTDVSNIQMYTCLLYTSPSPRDRS